MTEGLCQHTTASEICIRSRDHAGDHVLATKTLTSEERFHQIASQFPIDADGRVSGDPLDGIGLNGGAPRW